MKTLSLIKRAMLAGAALSLVCGGAAVAAEWKLTEVSGTVRIAAPGADAAPAKLNQTLPTGTSVTTFQGARATLDNGLQHIVVGPNSRMTVAPDTANGFTRVIQDLGAVMFQVDKQAKPHFRVDTPLLAAVVKGTTFTVEVEAQASSVNVAEGVVEVRSNLNDLGRDVPAGSSGTIRRDAPAAVQVISLTTATTGGPVQPAVAIAPIDYKAATQGLVENVPAAGAARTAISAPSASPGLSDVRDAADHPAQAPSAGAGVAVTTLASHGAGSEVRTEQANTPAPTAVATSANANSGGVAAPPAPPAAPATPAGNGNAIAVAVTTPVTAPAAAGSKSAGAGGAGNGNGNGASSTVGGGGGSSASKGSGNSEGSGNGNGNGTSASNSSGSGSGEDGKSNSGKSTTTTTVATAGGALPGVTSSNGNSSGNNGSGNSGSHNGNDSGSSSGSSNGSDSSNSGSSNSGGEGGGNVVTKRVQTVTTTTTAAVTGVSGLLGRR